MSKKFGAYMLVDRSGSMQNQWVEVIGSINTYVAGLPQDAPLFIAVFDSGHFDVVRNCTVGEFKEVSANEFAPRGGTPLLDSAARIMYRMLDDGFERAALTIITDGEENSSQKFKVSDVKYLISSVESKGYQVLYLGANFDKVTEQARGIGLSETKYMNMTTANFTETMQSYSTNTAFYAAGSMASVDFDAGTKAAAVKK